MPALLSAELTGQAQSDGEELPTDTVVAPIAHAVHPAAAAAAEKVPCAHTAQVKLSISVPAGHAHVSEPPTTTADISGSAHAHADAEVEPAGLLAPAGQAVHDTAPSLSLKVLAGHWLHSALMPLGPYVPAKQSVHVLDPATLVRPLPHAAQSPAEVLPLVPTDVPAGQSVHRASPISSA